MPEGRQSPPPERQTGRQQQDPPASGRTGKANPQAAVGDPQGQLKNLESNPKGVLDDFVEKKFEKQQ